MPDHAQLLEDHTTLTRRRFTLQAALAVLAGCVITITDACSNDSPTTPSPATGDITGVISANHGHNAVITAARITATNAFSLDIQGSAVHNHTVALSQADLQTLKNRQAITRDSSNDPSAAFGPHSHSVTFTPA
jgi:hypothetical protein